MITTQIAAHTALTAAEPAAKTAQSASTDQPGTNPFYEMFNPKNWEAPTKAASAQPSTAAAPAAATKDPTSIPEVQQLFGPSPFQQNPSGYGPDGKTWSYNPLYFATPEAAQTVANMVGGQVIEQNQFCPVGPLHQAQPNEVIQLSNGRTFNAGEFIGLFSHGYPQSYVDRLVQQELTGQVSD